MGKIVVVGSSNTDLVVDSKKKYHRQEKLYLEEILI